jgi:hypothetical protein
LIGSGANPGAKENIRLATEARPSKTLAPWWEDLTTNSNSNTGLVSYTTLGSAPDQVFVIQWKNVRAFWDWQMTTMELNFQVRLYESTNAIEFHYGPIIPGTYGATDDSDLGASIGFKDHMGGFLHFFDIISNSSGTVDDLRTDLSPLTDWPGPDSCFVIQTITTDVIDEVVKMPVELALYQNYPNPFNPTTTISYNLPKAERVVLKIFNSLGQEVKTLIDRMQGPGVKSVVWDGRDTHGLAVSSGVYMYRLQVNEEVHTRKMLILK